MPPPPDSLDLTRASSALPGSACGNDVLGAMQLPAAGPVGSFDGLLPESLADAQVWLCDVSPDHRLSFARSTTL